MAGDGRSQVFGRKDSSRTVRFSGCIVPPGDHECSATGENMKKIWSIAVLLFFMAVLSAQAEDNMKAFPPAEKGMVRYVLQLPKQDDESASKVELIVGKAVLLVEVNK